MTQFSSFLFFFRFLLVQKEQLYNWVTLSFFLFFFSFDRSIELESKMKKRSATKRMTKVNNELLLTFTEKKINQKITKIT